jgi:hypothetical protein
MMFRNFQVTFICKRVRDLSLGPEDTERPDLILGKILMFVDNPSLFQLVEMEFVLTFYLLNFLVQNHSLPSF